MHKFSLESSNFKESFTKSCFLVDCQKQAYVLIPPFLSICLSFQDTVLSELSQKSGELDSSNLVYIWKIHVFCLF